MKSYILILGLSITSACAVAQVSPYVFPDFVKANVLQKNGAITEGMLNYNTVTQEMLFLDNGVKTVLEMNNVDTIFIMDKKFVPVSGPLFYQKLTDTKVPLYVQLINKPLLHGRNPDLDDQINNNISAANGINKTNQSKSSKYDLAFGQDYTLQSLNNYYIKTGKGFTKVDDLKKIIKLFPVKSRRFRLL